MSTILDKILATKRDEVRALLAATPLADLRARAADAGRAPSFHGALTAGGGPRLIAEIKKASPSKGVIRADFDPPALAKAYLGGGASALSILTDRQYFQGDLAYIGDVRRAVALPILRKDFIVDESQILEARIVGASAVLLIAAALEPAHMAELYGNARGLGLDVLVEVHDEDDVARLDASRIPARIVGINNRDLRTFHVDLAVTERIVPLLGRRDVVVSESGIFTPADVARVAAAGTNAILVGESLMRQADVEAATRELLAPAGRTA